jgi:hypothetical protein
MIEWKTTRKFVEGWREDGQMIERVKSKKQQKKTTRKFVEGWREGWRVGRL